MKRKKSSDQILLFLVKNSTPEYHSTWGDSMHKTYIERDKYTPNKKKRSKKEKLHDLLLRLSGTTRYICESKKLEKFLGEKISFEKHLRKLHEDGILCFDGVPEKGDFYDTPNYRVIFDNATGQIGDYKLNKSWVAFSYREDKVLDDFADILKDAEDLGLL
ncbi:hypothetical protein UFOVP1290_222 [uncultured Caudovirales phage]|uniref:Uncharacterized protein n=1 Tax=uncultured Caudovirales phage TaxID=2100421 RepID=A0A6J5RKV7_9CAUD|nr:hypothetical protein UFOVP1290_222 [uncultured Caudovirales phage]